MNEYNYRLVMGVFIIIDFTIICSCYKVTASIFLYVLCGLRDFNHRVIFMLL